MLPNRIVENFIKHANYVGWCKDELNDKQENYLFPHWISEVVAKQVNQVDVDGGQ